MFLFQHISYMSRWNFTLSWDEHKEVYKLNLVTTASDEDPKLKLIVHIGFCTAKSDIPQYLGFAYFLSHAHIDETFYPEYHSGLIRSKPCLKM